LQVAVNGRDELSVITVEWSGVEWSGVEWSEVEWSEVRKNKDLFDEVMADYHK
jgi:hypothetical protein